MLPIQSDRPQPDLPPSRAPLDPRGTRRPLHGRRHPRRAPARRGRGRHPRAADRAPGDRDPVRRHAQRRHAPPPRAPRQRPRQTPGRAARHRRDQRGRRPTPLPPSARTRRRRARLHRRRVAAGHLRHRWRRCSSPRSWTTIHRRSSGRPRRRCAGSQARSPASTRTLARPRRPSPTRSLACSSCACSPTPPARASSSGPRPGAVYAAPGHAPPAPWSVGRPACGEERGRAGFRQETPRRIEAGPRAGASAKRSRVRVAERKQVLRCNGGEHRRVDGAESLADGEERVDRRPVLQNPSLLSGRHRHRSGRTVAAGRLCGVGASVTMPAGRWGRSGARPGGAVGSRWLRTGLLRSCALASGSLVTYRPPLQRFVVGSLRGAAAPRPSGN